MKKLLKAVKLFGIAVTASAALLAGIYFYDTKAIANDNVSTWFSADNSRETEIVVKESAKTYAEPIQINHEEASEAPLEIATEKVTEATEAAETSGENAENDDLTVEESEATEAAVESTNDTVKTTEAAVITETVSEAPSTEAATETPSTEAATEAPVQVVTEAPVPEAPALTNIVYTDVNGNKYNFSSIYEAKATLNVAVLPDPAGTAVANKSRYAAEAAQVLELINQYRTANGLPTVTYNDTLATAAMERAAENAYADWNMTATENGAKRHIRPNFQKASTIRDEYGISGSWGENFGRYQWTASEIVENWKASASHNALLLSADYSNIGIGVAQDSEGYFYWIALFN